MLVRSEPPADLRPWVEFVTQRRVEGPKVGLRIVPTARVELLFNFGDPFETGRDLENTHALDNAAVLGARHLPYSQIAGPNIDWFLVSLTPRGCRKILGKPLSLLWETDSPLSDHVERAEVGALFGLLLQEASFEGRLSLLTEFVRDRPEEFGDREVAEAAARSRAGVTITIPDLCRTLDIGPRRLRQRFKSEIGVAPKTWLSILKFGKHLTDTHPAPWLPKGLSGSADYADDSHATQAFHRFAETTPGRYRREKAQTGDALVFTSATVELTRTKLGR